jgi:microcystin-dependent protein
VPLTQAQLPAHSHTIQGSADNATIGVPGPTTVLATLASGTLYDSGVPNPTLERNLSPQSIPVVGGSVPHSNLMPTTALNYIIATVGVYPQQA